MTEFTTLSDTCTDATASLLLNNLPEAILFLDRQFKVVLCNQLATDVIYRSFRKKVVTGMPALELVDGKKKGVVQTFLNGVLSGKTRTLESPQTVHDDQQEIYEHTFLPAQNTTGETVGILVRSVDITLRKKAERAIQEAEERWQFAFEASNQAAWDWNLQTNEVIYSSSYKKMYGFTGDELTNDLSEWKSRVHPEDRQLLDNAIQEHIQSDDPYYEIKYRIQLKNGDYKWIMARGKLLNKDAEGKPLRMIGTHTDLTQTMQTKEEIRQMNQRFHYAAKASSQALWEWNAVTGEAYVSPSFTEMFGWETDENKHFDQWHTYVHPDDRRQTVDEYYRILYNTENSTWEATYRFLKADGSYAIVSDKAYILRNEQKEVIKVIGATEDVTALKRAEKELYNSNERFAIMMKATHEMLWDWDICANTVYRSAEGLRNVYGTGDNADIETVDKWLKRVHPDDHENVHRGLERVLKAKHHETFELEYRFKRDDGGYVHIYDRGILITNDAGEPVRMIGAAQNISERKRLEAELLKNELEMKKRINQATVDSQEQERSEIGRELHDNINQVLTTTKLYLELALSKKDMTEELVRKSCANINKAINEIRQLSRSLMDPTIGDLGIVDSINDLVENLNLTQKVHISLTIDSFIEIGLDRNQKLTIFRIIQEALNNVIKHARANCVTVAIQQKEGEVQVEICDDGIGFLHDSVKKGAGLKNITNRVYLINGRLQIQSSPGKGCRIKINFPVNKTN